MNRTVPEFDCAVVGGGIFGAMAYHYARAEAPNSRLILFERNTIGCGSTGYSGGLMPVIGPTQTAMALALQSRSLYEDMLAADPSTPLSERDTYWIFPRERLSELEAAVGRSLDVQDTLLPELLKIYPELRLPDGYLIAFDNSVWVADPYHLTQRLITQTASSNSGESVVAEGIEILKIVKGDAHLQLHRSDGGVTRARRVIIATGPWVTRAPTRAWADDKGIRIKRTACLHFRRSLAGSAPVLIFYGEQAFILPQPERDRILMNYTAEEWDVSPLIGEMQVTEKDTSMAFGILEQFLPDLARDYSGGQVFCDAYAPHRRPWVEALDALPGCIMLAGGSGSGVRFAPGLAKQALSLAFPTDGVVKTNKTAHY